MQSQQQTVVTTSTVVQPQYVVQTAPIVSSYNHVQSTIIGIALIIIGSLSIIFNITDVAAGNGFPHYDTYNILSTHSNGLVGNGFWCGVLVSIIFHMTSLDYLEGRF